MNKIELESPRVEKGFVVTDWRAPSRGKLLDDLLKIRYDYKPGVRVDDQDVSDAAARDVLAFVRKHGPIGLIRDPALPYQPMLPPYPAGSPLAYRHPPGAKIPEARHEPISAYSLLAEYCRAVLHLKGALHNHGVTDATVRAIQHSYWRRAWIGISNQSPQAEAKLYRMYEWHPALRKLHPGDPPSEPMPWSKRARTMIEVELTDTLNWLVFWSDLSPTVHVVPETSMVTVSLGLFYGDDPQPAQALVLELFTRCQADRTLICSGCGKPFEAKRVRADGHGFHFCPTCRASGRKRAVLIRAQRQRERNQP